MSYRDLPQTEPEAFARVRDRRMIRPTRFNAFATARVTADDVMRAPANRLCGVIGCRRLTTHTHEVKS